MNNGGKGCGAADLLHLLGRQQLRPPALLLPLVLFDVHCLGLPAMLQHRAVIALLPVAALLRLHCGGGGFLQHPPGANKTKYHPRVFFKIGGSHCIFFPCAVGRGGSHPSPHLPARPTPFQAFQCRSDSVEGDSAEMIKRGTYIFFC